MVPMGIPLDARHGPFSAHLDPDRILRYAEATNDTNGRYRDGTAVPPTFPAVLAFEVQGAAFAAIPPEVMDLAAARVHGEHDIRLFRPLVPGEVLHATTMLSGVRTNRSGAVVTQRIEQRDDRDAVVVEQWWSLFLGGVALVEAGDGPPDHVFPETARARSLGRYSVALDENTPVRYAEVSGDWSAHHFDEAAARRSGAAAPFAHGLCSMAMCSQALVETAAGGDPTRVRRVAVRFAAPALLGHQLDVDLFDTGGGSIAFEATCAGVTVIRNGLGEVSPEPAS